ncbi:MAG: aminotransferase class IV family protein [Phycisphaerae bacterium]|nr:aminotransferase class IV family protein [Saprospiraceae bacterium]
MVNLNGQLLPILPDSFALLQRATYYGDGLFETLRAFEGQVPFWPLHWERFSNGLKVLGFEVPSHWTSDYFIKEILKTSPHNARIRLTVWRSLGGLYLPTDNTPQFLVTTEPLQSGVFEGLGSGLEVCLCETVRLPVDSLSGIKILGGARYVAAAREARAKGVDDVIVLNAPGRVCEATGSNIIWLEGDIVFVPSSFDGQINGTLLKLLCTLLRAEGWEVREKPTLVDDLLGADEVLLTNAIRGIRWVRKFEGKVFGHEKSLHFNYLLVKHLKEKLTQNR